MNCESSASLWCLGSDLASYQEMKFMNASCITLCFVLMKVSVAGMALAQQQDAVCCERTSVLAISMLNPVDTMS